MMMPDDKKSTEEAEFVDIKKENQVPAIIHQPFRHDLMKKEECEPDYVKVTREELELDEALGLKRQTIMDQQISLKKDIDTLTGSRNYFEIKPKHLEKLFRIKWLKFRVMIFNIRETILGTHRSMDYWAYLLIGLMFFCPYLATKLHFAFKCNPTFLIVIACTFCVIFYALTVACLAKVIWKIGKELTFEYNFLEVYIKMEDVDNTEIKIPKGAKIKTLDAQEEGLFKKFIIARPFLKINHESFKDFLPKINFDPAILGVTDDGRMFMIVWWDIKKDIERIIKNINAFKKFKLKH